MAPVFQLFEAFDCFLDSTRFMSPCWHLPLHRQAGTRSLLYMCLCQYLCTHFTYACVVWLVTCTCTLIAHVIVIIIWFLCLLYRAISTSFPKDNKPFLQYPSLSLSLWFISISLLPLPIAGNLISFYWCFQILRLHQFLVIYFEVVFAVARSEPGRLICVIWSIVFGVAGLGVTNNDRNNGEPRSVVTSGDASSASVSSVSTGALGLASCPLRCFALFPIWAYVPELDSRPPWQDN